MRLRRCGLRHREDVDRKNLPRRLPEDDHSAAVATYLQAGIEAFDVGVCDRKQRRRGRNGLSRSGIPQPESLLLCLIPGAAFDATTATQGLLWDVTEDDVTVA